MTSTTCWASLFHLRTVFRPVVQRSLAVLGSYTGEDNLMIVWSTAVSKVEEISSYRHLHDLVVAHNVR